MYPGWVVLPCPAVAKLTDQVVANDLAIQMTGINIKIQRATEGLDRWVVKHVSQEKHPI